MSFRRDHDPSAEEATDALVDGDQPLSTGTAVAALRHRDFRVVWAGTFASNIGTWMQNVFLGAFAFRLTHDASYVGLIYFAAFMMITLTLAGIQLLGHWLNYRLSGKGPRRDTASRSAGSMWWWSKIGRRCS